MPNDHKMSTKWTVHMFANDNDVQKSNPQSMTNRMALKKDEGKRSKLMCIYIIIYIYINWINHLCLPHLAASKQLEPAWLWLAKFHCSAWATEMRNLIWSTDPRLCKSGYANDMLTDCWPVFPYVSMSIWKLIKIQFESDSSDLCQTVQALDLAILTAGTPFDVQLVPICSNGFQCVLIYPQ